MPRTIQAALDEFAASQVDLNPNQVAQARASRDFLKNNLLATPCASATAPRMTGEVLHFGSFARRTKIRPLDDIDLMFVIDLGAVLVNASWMAPGSVTVTSSAAGHYFLGTFHQPVQQRFLRPDGSVNSTTVLNDLRGRLQGVPHYRSAEIKRNGVAVVLNLTSYPWNFDVVPALPVSDGTRQTQYYVIPDGRGGWQKTDPRRDAGRMTQANQAAGGHLLRVIRLVKYWNVRQGQSLESYHLETLCLDAFRWGFPGSTISALQQCFSHIAQVIYQPCPDPKGLGSDLSNRLSFEQQQRVHLQALSAAQVLQQAAGALVWNSHPLASRHLQQVFGPSFPVCL